MDIGQTVLIFILIIGGISFLLYGFKSILNGPILIIDEDIGKTFYVLSLNDDIAEMVHAKQLTPQTVKGTKYVLPDGVKIQEKKAYYLVKGENGEIQFKEAAATLR